MSGYFPFSLSNGLMGPVIPTPPVQQDLLDYSGTGKVQSARYINPLTMDFEVNTDNGQLLGQNATDQSVILALTTTFGSSSVLGLGNNFSSIPTIGADITSQMTKVLNQALNSLVQNGNIILQNVQVFQTAPSTVAVSFTYYNQSLNVNQTVQFTIQNGVMVNG